MDQIMWDCQTVHAGGSLSDFQRQVLGDLYGGRARAGRAGRWSVAGDRQTLRIATRRIADRGARHAAAHEPSSGWAGVAVVSVLALLPLVMSLYAALGDL